VALEEIVRARCEIPGYTTLDEMATRIRARVNGGFIAGIVGRMTDAQIRGLELLLQVDPTTRHSGFDALKALSQQRCHGPQGNPESTSPRLLTRGTSR
jgi:hypothetical protein